MSGARNDPYVAEAYQALAADPDPDRPDGPARDVTGLGVIDRDGHISSGTTPAELTMPEGRSMADANNDYAALLREAKTLRGRVANQAREIGRGQATIKMQGEQILALRERLQRRTLDSGEEPIVGGRVTDAAKSAYATLPPRRRQIAELAASGMTMVEIARSLGLSHHTIKTHMQYLYRDLGVSRRAELTLLVNSWEHG